MTGRLIRIIGIDPGLRRTGWGVIESRRRAADLRRERARHLGRARTIWPTACASCTRGCRACIASFKPQEAAVEETFVNENARATLKLGQARGMALLAPAHEGPARRRVSAQPDQEDRDRRRPRREAADPGHDRLPAAEGQVRERRRGRCAGHRHLPRQPSRRERAQSLRGAQSGSVQETATRHDRQAQGHRRRDRREPLPSSTSTASATRCRPRRARCAT